MPSNPPIDISEQTLTVLLATFNGSAYLDQQLRSIADQDWEKIDIVVSDDGSNDGTQAVLDLWKTVWTKGSFRTIDGPQQGFSENFRHLLTHSDPAPGYIAFCDQDDIWLPQKTRSAIVALAGSQKSPALYCARTFVVDQDGLKTGQSPLFRRPPAFSNALVQNIGGGNTMVLNSAGFDLLAAAARRTGFVSHDWFAYQIVSGAGGTVLYSPIPHVLYRQHGGNLVGSNNGVHAKLERIRMLLRGRFAAWTTRNVASLRACEDLLAEDARRTLSAFEQARTRPLPRRLSAFFKSGVHRQTLSGQMSLFLACLLKKL